MARDFVFLYKVQSMAILFIRCCSYSESDMTRPRRARRASERQRCPVDDWEVLGEKRREIFSGVCVPSLYFMYPL